MRNPRDAGGSHDVLPIKALTCMMFFTFAMTTDAVGSVIPELLREFDLTLTAAGAFHYVPMIAIAAGGLALGFLADHIGRKATIILGLVAYGVSSLLFAFGSAFAFFVLLLAAAGVGVSIFKVGALALIGDVSRSTREHTSFMNTVEGFFGVGAIAGPAIVATLLAMGVSWKYLYVFAAAICGLLIAAAAVVRYPPTPGPAHGPTPRPAHEPTPGSAHGPTPGSAHEPTNGPVQGPTHSPANFARTLTMLRNPYALGFSALIMLYVAVEVAIYVWMPTYLASHEGSVGWLAAYALTIFFVLRAAGRFVGAWVLGRASWRTVLAAFSLAILLCFAGSLYGGPAYGVYLLPLSGLFMSVVYPTLNSKGISCFARPEHGAVAGIILFFTAFAAAVGPLAMAAVSDAFGDIKFGFVLATGFALLLFVGSLLNWRYDPAGRRLAERDDSDYVTAL